MSTKLNVLAAAVLALAAGTALAAAADGKVTHEGPSVSTPAAKLGFGPTGVKTDIGELMAGPAYGDLAHGRHGTFIRMPAGFVSPDHTHTEDYFAVVIKGVGVNSQTGVQDVPLPVGSYWFQKGEEPHVTKCVSKEECLFFIVQPGRFDYVPAK